MSQLPTMQITIVLNFRPAESDEQYTLTGTCSTTVNDSRPIVGTLLPLVEFMNLEKIKQVGKNHIDVTLSGKTTHMYCCDVSAGLSVFTAALRHAKKQLDRTGGLLP